jgi:hypothetical protein
VNSTSHATTIIILLTEYSVKRIINRVLNLREEFLALLQTFLPLLRTQSLQPRPARIEHGPRGKPQFHKIVPVLSGEDEIVLPAIETPAQERATIIDRAPRSAEIHALTVRLGSEQIYRIPSRQIRHNAMPVPRDFVSLFRVEHKTLITPAALRTPIARHIGLSVQNQPPV